ncbi:hypothetical protein, partial [Achromobacter animicus]|uniref:hypothetical protein n=1 Tax=Achromobacter animicus TaxID=1389935 RepID=UPI0028AF5AC3
AASVSTGASIALAAIKFSLGPTAFDRLVRSIGICMTSAVAIRGVHGSATPDGREHPARAAAGEPGACSAEMNV